MTDGKGPFGSIAERYWDAGLVALPLNGGGKAIKIEGWTRWCSEMPDDDTKSEWLLRYGPCNVGLACGPASGIVGIDIDTTDQRLISAITEVLPYSPYERFGRKGKMLAFVYSGEKSISVRDDEGNTIVDVISIGRQFVLPPSIHPDTGLAYRDNIDLAELKAKGALPRLPRDFELLIREKLKECGVRLRVSERGGPVRVTEWVSKGGRDNALVRQAGFWAAAVCRGEVTFMRALNNIVAWVESLTEKVVGDEMDPRKAIEKLAEFLVSDVLERSKSLPEDWDEGLSDELRVELRLDAIGADKTRLPPDIIFSQIFAELGNVGDHEDKSQYQMEVVHKGLVRMAAHKEMDPTQEGRLLKLLTDGAGRQFTQADLKKQLKRMRLGRKDPESHEEVAQMLLEDIQRFGEVRFDFGKFWEWHGSSWKEIALHDLKNFVASHYGRLGVMKRSSDHGGVIDLFKSKVTKPLQQIARPGINFANGYLTEDLELIPHDPNYGTNYVFPFQYDPSKATECPMWLEMLWKFWGHEPDYEDRVACLREAIAATIFGVATMYNKAFLFYGEPGSGKSTVLNVIRGLMPPGTTSEVRPENFGEKFELVQMMGKLMNYVAEMRDTKKINAALFKQIVEGAPISVEYKGKDKFTHIPRCAHWFATNKIPKVDSPDGGYDRRWMIFEFRRSVAEQERIPGYSDMVLDQEGDAILAWAVEAIKMLKINKGYTTPVSSMRAVGDMSRNSDSVRFYFDHSLGVGRLKVGEMVGGDTSISAQLLHTDYRHFCRNKAFVSAVSLPDFTERFKWRGLSMGLREVFSNTGQTIAFTYCTLVDPPAGSL